MIAALLAGCATLHQPGAGPVPAGAAEALARARAIERGSADTEGVERREALEQARALAPSWVAPQRLLDELDKERLRGPLVLTRRRAGVEAGGKLGERARAAYLMGRLEGADGEDRMWAATRLDPSFAWGHHGLAWCASESGDRTSAVLHEERAIALSREAFDRALFTLSLARHLLADEHAEEAHAVLLDESVAESLAGSDLVWWRAECAMFGLGLQLEEEGVLERSWLGLLEVMGEELLGEADAVRLAQVGRAARREHRALDPGGLRLDAVLARREEDSLLYQRARLAHECGRLVRAAALWERLAEGDLRPPTRAWRVADFAAGHFRKALERWFEGLPMSMRDATSQRSLKRALVQVMGETRNARVGRALELRALGERCLEAGWYAEARAMAPHLAAVDPEAALSLLDRADRAFGLLGYLDRSLGKELQPIPDAEAEASEEWLGIARFLSGLGREVEAAQELFGEEQAAHLKRALAESPLYVFTPFAALVHPGPSISRQDQRLGVGRAGEKVSGLAELGEAMGRFILLGQVSGSDRADGAVFPVLATERVSGNHRGVEFSGTVFWCEGIEPVGWLGRNKGTTGAALHDGYWIDVEAVRRGHEHWLRLQREWPLSEAREVLNIALPAAEDGEARRALRPLVGAGKRVMLGVLVDRGGEVPDLEELLENVACHEQGHLVDRKLHLPLSAHPLRTVRLLGRAAFDAGAILERLEYRAQVVALCTAPDPRIILAESLAMAESAPPMARAHARGYAAMLADLLGLLDQRVQADPEDWPAIDPGAVLVQQLGRLTPEQVRSLGYALSRRVGIP